MRTFIVSIILLNSLFPLSCHESSILNQYQGKRSDGTLVSRQGSEQSFDIATWNIEHFPKDKVYTISFLKQIIHDMDLDLIAVQEIDDRNSFMQLVDSLKRYEGYSSPLPDYGQHLGIIYKSDFISITNPEQIYVDDEWSFPRPPLLTFVTVRKNNNIVFDFFLVIVHLKAFLDEESESRRKTSCQKLKYYIDTFLLSGSEKDVVILGDFNDELKDPPDDNIFSIFLHDSLNYHFLTLPLSDEKTYLGTDTGSLDHIIITADALDDYNKGKICVLKIDEEFDNYINFISDHRPVLAQFFVF